MPEVIDELLCKGRPSIGKISNEQLLYKRFTNEELDVESGGVKLAIDRFHLPAFSVNCGQFSKPEHVLHPSYNGWGIAQLKVNDLVLFRPIKTGVGTSNHTSYTLEAHHDPQCHDEDQLKDNYAHSEVRVIKDGQAFEGKKVKSIKVKTAIRIYLAEQTTIFKPPTV